MLIFYAIQQSVRKLPELSANTPEQSIGQPINIGGIELPNRAFLAPMSGVTDLPFRKLAHQYGAGLVVSEMVASEAFLTGQEEMQLKVLSGGIPTHMVQIAGREAHWMAKAAQLAQDNGANIIDINMGCPAKRVTTGYSGSALMRDLDHALSLIEAVVGAVNVPVTLKMRLGWDDNSINAPELAKRAEDAGVQMITVHGRTRCQFYKGKADWQAVNAVKNVTSLPVVVNGDVMDNTTADMALQNSGADAVMIGRGAYGAPWLPAYIAGVISETKLETLKHNYEAVIAHHEDMLAFYGLQSGIRQARKHLGWYLSNLNLPPSSAGIKKIIMTSFSHKEIHDLLAQAYAMHEQGNDYGEAAA